MISDRDKLEKYIIKTLIFWRKKQIAKAKEWLIKVREFIVSETTPNQLYPVMLDFMTDEGMWDWVEAKTIRSKYDFEAAYLVFSSLEEIYYNNKILMESV